MLSYWQMGEDQHMCCVVLHRSSFVRVQLARSEVVAHYLCLSKGLASWQGNSSFYELVVLAQMWDASLIFCNVHKLCETLA
jgi:hypothetical protein